MLKVVSNTMTFHESRNNKKNGITQVTKREEAPESEWRNWNWKSEGDLMEVKQQNNSSTNYLLRTFMFIMIGIICLTIGLDPKNLTIYCYVALVLR